MNHLTTQLIKNEDNLYLFSWATGSARRGLLSVNINKVTEFPHLAAEARAIAYLIFEKNVFDRVKIYSGKGIHIHVSNQSTLDALLNGSKDRLVRHLTKFYFARLFGCLTSVNDELQLSYFNGLDKHCAPETIDLMFDDCTLLQTPKMGLVRITKHAILQYKERLKSGDPQDPLKSIIRRLMNPNIQIQKIPLDTIFKKKLKHGISKKDEHWGHDSDDVHFIVVRNPRTNVGSIVTTYVRPPQYMAS